MKLMIYDLSSSCRRKSTIKRPMLRIYERYFVMYPELLNLLDLSITDKVKLAQDQDNPNDFYICKDNTNGFNLRKYGVKNGLSANNSVLCKILCERFGRTSLIPVANTPIEMDGQKWYALITSAVIVPKDGVRKVLTVDVRKQY